MKGIILAGGLGTRLYPLTISVSKQLLPLFDKPMIYYPLTTLIELGIKDILLICKKEDKNLFKKLLNNGSQWGLKISYEVQDKPSGIAESFIIGKDFIKNDNVALILGDNIFYGINYHINEFTSGANIFAYKVNDPQRYGVVELKNKTPIKIVEKPKKPKSNYAVVGLYYYPNNVIEIAKNVKPSKRGELEITSINSHYMSVENLNVQILGRGFAWLDTGTVDSINNASNYIRTIEERQGYKIACLEEIAYLNNFIDENQLVQLIQKLPNDYANYLRRLIDN